MGKNIDTTINIWVLCLISTVPSASRGHVWLIWGIKLMFCSFYCVVWHSGTRIKSCAFAQALPRTLYWADWTAMQEKKSCFASTMCNSDFWLISSCDFWGGEGWYNWRRTDCRLRTQTHTHISIHHRHTHIQDPTLLQMSCFTDREKNTQLKFVSVFVVGMRQQQNSEREKGHRERFNLNYPCEQRHLMRSCGVML